MKGKDEVVGKGRPPAGTRWKPGQSGNPKGRPKGVKNMMTYFNQALSRKVNLRLGEKIHRVTVREGIAMVITNLALKGDPKLIPLVLSIDRDINANMKRENIKTITNDMTPREAMNFTAGRSMGTMKTERESFSLAGGTQDAFWLDKGDDFDQSRKVNFASGVFYRPAAPKEPPSP
jgi:hypothetical protein